MREALMMMNSEAISADNVWLKTHSALNKFFQTLTCSKCHEVLDDPHQFLNCGHFACRKCIGSATECMQCKIPGTALDICPDKDLNDLLLNLNVIAKAVKFSFQESNTNYDSGLSSVTKNIEKRPKKIDKQIINKVTKPKEVDKILNHSICESNFSRSSFKSKVSEIIPKNINKKNKKGETALHIASRSNNEDRVMMLLEAGANPNTKDFAGWTPLQEATSFGLYNICETLLKAGANPDMPGYDSRTALHEAVLNDDCRMATLLLNSNASKKVFDNVGKTPETYCKSKSMADLFKGSQNLTMNKSDIISEIHRSLDLDKTLQQNNSELKIVLYGSELNQKNRKLLLDLGSKKKLKVVNAFSSSVTHIIIDTNETNYVKPTLDILLTMLHGKWLVSSDCLLILQESNDITAEDFSLFEINPPQLDDAPVRARENNEKQIPKLFNNCFFYFAIKNYNFIDYEGMKITKDVFTKLVEAGDGITLKREPRPEDIQGSLSPFHVAHDPNHTLHKCTHYILYYDSINSEANRMLYNMPFLKSLPFMWFVECILKFKLVDPVELGLLS